MNGKLGSGDFFFFRLSTNKAWNGTFSARETKKKVISQPHLSAVDVFHCLLAEEEVDVVIVRQGIYKVGS